MKIALVTSGSRGDVQPVVALALALRAAGHDVRLATHAEFGGLAAAYGLPFHPVAGDVRAAASSPQARELLRWRNPLAVWSGMVALLRDSAAAATRDVLRACEGADALGFSGMAMFAGDGVAEKLGIPAFGAFPIPFPPSRHLPNVLLPPWLARLPGGARLSHGIARHVVWRAFGGAVNRVRREVLGLPRYPRRGPFDRWSSLPLVLGFSPHVVPRPPDWPAHVHVTGAWHLDPPPGWSPPRELEAFLGAGEPPVCVGFGSMAGRDPERDAQVAVEALRRAGQRGILVAGWAGLGRRALPPEVLAVESVPHAWLFPRCRAVVHHGGAGTTAAALRAGVPAVVVPFNFDQPFWAARVHALGCGPRPLPHRRLEVEPLAAALRVACEDAGVGARARALGERLRAEDGAARAAEAIGRILRA